MRARTCASPAGGVVIAMPTTKRWGSSGVRRRAILELFCERVCIDRVCIDQASPLTRYDRCAIRSLRSHGQKRMLHSGEVTPEVKAPSLACDTHFHVFGPADRYPHATHLRYPQPRGPLADYLAPSTRLGIERTVFGQPSRSGRNTSCMLDAMRKIGPQRCRGIVDIDENLAESEVARLHAIGVRGVRINVNPVK